LTFRGFAGGDAGARREVARDPVLHSIAPAKPAIESDPAAPENIGALSRHGDGCLLVNPNESQ
jgi:hypothetical protein